MTRRTRWLLAPVLLLSTSTLAVLGFSELNVRNAMQAQEEQTAKAYTAYNLWYEQPTKMFSINYRRGAMIPAGTEVATIEVGDRNRRRPFVKFTTAKDKATYTIYFQKNFHAGISIDKFKERLLTTKPLEELVSELSEKEVEAIGNGRLVVGMSRRAVIISRGYPPEHRTPSTEANRWVYWENRFKKKVVHFDASGRTKKPGAVNDDL